MGSLEITIEDKRGSEVQNKYDIDELLLMLTLRHTLTNRSSISPCKTWTYHIAPECGLVDTFHKPCRPRSFGWVGPLPNWTV